MAIESRSSNRAIPGAPGRSSNCAPTSTRATNFATTTNRHHWASTPGRWASPSCGKALHYHHRHPLTPDRREGGVMCCRQTSRAQPAVDATAHGVQLGLTSMKDRIVEHLVP